MPRTSMGLSTTIALCIAMFLPRAASAAEPEDSAPLKVLLVAGGCCHDYATQTKLLAVGIEKRINAKVTIVLSESKATTATFEIYESDDWAKGYDVVVHDECSANVTERPYVDRILKAHLDGVPAVNLHCAMHSYRWGEFRKPVEPGADNASWFEMLGLQSSGHGPKHPIDVVYVKPEHPVANGLERWTTTNEELYNNVRVFEGTTVLATGRQVVPPSKKDLQANPDAKGREASAVIAWTSEFGPKKTRIFSTSLGHQNETVGDPRYLDFVVRGVLWSTGNITEDGKAKAPYAKE